MTTATLHETMTAEELLELGDVGRCELIEGKVVKLSPSGFEHGTVTARLARLMDGFVEERKLGRVVGAETGFVLARNPDTVRGADTAFVSAGRLKGGMVKGYFEGAPDLAVEVNSPGDRESEVLAKVDQWLGAGAKSVWVVDPPTRSVVIHRAGGEIRRFRLGEDLKDDVLPGFSVRVDRLFE